MRARSVFAVMLMLLAASGWFVLPRGLEATSLLAEEKFTETPDGTAIVEYRLRRLGHDDYTGAILAALEQGDADLAKSLADLAASRTIDLEPALLTRIIEAKASEDNRQAADAWNGFISGNAPNEAALAGAIAADLSGYGDIRDLFNQARAHLAGEPVDHFTIGVAAVGLTITAATVATLGGTAPARAGLSTVKIAARAGKLSRPLLRQVTRIAQRTIDAGGFARLTRAARAVSLSEARLAARSVVRPGPAKALRQLGDDVATLGKNTGYRGTLQALNIAENTEDVGRAARLSTRFGARTRGVLAIAGSAALTFASVSLSIANWLFWGVIWLFTAIWWVSRFGVWLLNKVF